MTKDPLVVYKEFLTFVSNIFWGPLVYSCKHGPDAFLRYLAGQRRFDSLAPDRPHDQLAHGLIYNIIYKIIHVKLYQFACLSCAVYRFEGKYIYSILFYSEPV